MNELSQAVKPNTVEELYFDFVTHLADRFSMPSNDDVDRMVAAVDMISEIVGQPFPVVAGIEVDRQIVEQLGADVLPYKPDLVDWTECIRGRCN